MKKIKTNSDSYIMSALLIGVIAGTIVAFVKFSTAIEQIVPHLVKIFTK